MYTYLKLKNFKSFGNVKLDLKKTEQKVKNLAVIYGENGAGKTNLVEAFKFLQDSLTSLISLKMLEKEFDKINQTEESQKQDKSEDFIKFLQVFRRKFSIYSRMEEMKTIGSKEDTEIEIGFSINNKEGYYLLKFSNEIKEEKLYYLVEQNRGILFHLQKNRNGEIEKELNKKIFKDSDYLQELETEIDKYWGKNSFLSIILKELHEKNQKYTEKVLSKNLTDIMTMMIQMNISVDNPTSNIIQSTGINSNNPRKNALLLNLRRGEINKNQEEGLNICEEILRSFFTQCYSEIKNVKYRRKVEKDKIKYSLVFEKVINNELVEINYNKESLGTQRILEKIVPIIRAALGEFVIIDEIDNGIHDLLMKGIIESIADKITGQLIITTHNTLLLETLDKSNIYIIVINYDGTKMINCMEDYDLEIQKNHNKRDLYLKGVFGGIPFVSRIDFDSIIDKIEKEEKNYEKKNQT